MIREHFRYKTTITTILAESEIHIGAAKEAMISARQEIERTILDYPLFGSSLEPLFPDELRTESTVINRMLNASISAGTGPMSAVAGTIAWSGVEAMIDAGAKYAVIDNGGDIAFVSDRPLKIGLYSGNSAISKKMAFVLPPTDKIYGVCTSSASVGPSISFGTADSTTVFSSDVSLADAWATYTCNILTPNKNESLIEKIETSGVDGLFGVIDDIIIKWGLIPKITSADVDERLITSG